MRELRRICITFVMFALVLLSPLFSVTAEAAEDAKTFSFELTVDGKDTKEVKAGDIITVVLRLKRTDKAEDFTMYAMQDEIRYDSQFFELVEGSAVLSNGIMSTDIAMVDQFREFYMNYLSMSGGEKWKADTMVGSFQLKVIGTSGVSTISNQDYLVSVKDGSDSYQCDAKDVTIILSTECVVSFQTSGGGNVTELNVQFGEKLTRPKDPVREGYRFEGWYKDIHLTEKWDFEQDTVQGNMSLYAKWKIIETESKEVEEPANEEKEPVAVDAPTGDTNNADSSLWFIVILVILTILLIGWYMCKKKTNRVD